MGSANYNALRALSAALAEASWPFALAVVIVTALAVAFALACIRRPKTSHKEPNDGE